MNNESARLTKIAFLYENETGITKEIVAAISMPVPVHGVEGNYCCLASVDELFPAARKISGVDPFQAVVLATEFVDRLLSAPHMGFEVRNPDGSRYVSTLGQFLSRTTVLG